ncbi:MAG: prepilin-type N-terminal cleavage/methylation domain-containing protein [Candidatus Gorgyraea atricola]|nr:prepilin-type N-terminal cleavage/methylation domain-containing protein [Candidatus Gorgyraea atricola]
MKKKGFTLIELVIVIVILGIIASTATPLLLAISDSVTFLISRAGMDQAADIALSRMAREMRRLKDDSSVNTAASSQFSFDDVNSNTISYSLSSMNLMRNSDILASDVQSLSFTYYGDSGSTISTPVVSPNETDIRRIDISLEFQSGDQTLYYESQVRPRNLRHANEVFF